ncbi:MAG: DUF5131 family protein [Candidatus Latescibacteria bacterium]|nr:DUF5131 family protein [Candidatus Latescibacterota bacterium]
MLKLSDHAESGPGARPIKEEWVVDIKDQCRVAHTPFFFKQWGGVRKKLAGRVLQGRTWDGMPRQIGMAARQMSLAAI